MEFRPLVPATFPDFEALFGPTGACMGCWCMWWRKTRAAAQRDARDGGEANRRDMEALVASGTVPGLLAYDGGRPVGWVSVAPRSQFASLARSRVLAPLDDRPTWSVICFYVAKDARRRGLARDLLGAAIRHAACNGATLLEAYPMAQPDGPRRRADWENYMGFPRLFEEAGFTVAARPSPARLVMRRTLRPEDA